MGTAKRGVFWGGIGHFGPRAANLAENTGNTANCLFWRIHLGPSMPAISGLSGPGGTMRNDEVPSKWQDGVGVAGCEMGPPLWADVFTLKSVNTAVRYPSQTLFAYPRHAMQPLLRTGGIPTATSQTPIATPRHNATDR